jgi:hypothetical protein
MWNEPAGMDDPKKPEKLKASIKSALNFLTVTRIRSLYRLFYPLGNTNRIREELIAIVSRALYFETQEKFNEWFATRTDAERIIIQKLTFYKAFPVSLLEQETGKILVTAKKDAYSVNVTISPDYKLFPLEFHLINDIFIMVMPEVLQIAFKPFLKPPEYHDPNGGISGETVIFNNEQGFAGMFALLCESLLAKKDSLRTLSRQNSMKLAKKDIEALYRESGFPCFPTCDFPVPDSLSLATSFVVSQNDSKLPLANDGSLREMVHRFFFFDPAANTDYYCFSGSYFEGLLVSVYMKKRSAIGYETIRELPEFRRVFFDFLKSIENRTTSAAMDEAFSFVLAKGVFCFSSIDVTSYYRLKASLATVGGVTYRALDNELTPEHTLFFELITKPLFRAYCFVFCALGCLELTLAEPPANIELRDAQKAPVSPYDSVCAVRLTELGRWCLGFTEEKPKEASVHYEITAHPTLLYVTLRGESLTRRVFLDKIGAKIGKERWTINAASFLCGCTDKAEVTERIKKFHDLVDEHPAEHWETFFTQIEKNAGAVDEITGDFFVYRIETAKETHADLLHDTAFRHLARLAEDNLVLVPRKNRQKFLAVLANHGISVFTTPFPPPFDPAFE